MQGVVAGSLENGPFGIMIIAPRLAGKKIGVRAFEFVIDELVDDGPDIERVDVFDSQTDRQTDRERE